MKKWLLIFLLSLALAIAWGGKGFAQTKKEMTFSGTHYWASKPKAFQVDPDRSIRHMELLGVRVNDSGDGPFHGASVHIVAVAYSSKGYNGFRAYETWTDKDGDKVIWELMDTPPGASTSPGRLIEGTGKYTGWQGTVEYTCSIRNHFPKGRCVESVGRS